MNLSTFHRLAAQGPIQLLDIQETLQHGAAHQEDGIESDESQSTQGERSKLV